MTKPGRLRSPSPYFSSSPHKHATGCTRRAGAGTASTPAAKTMAARSTRAVAPSEWRDAPPSPGGAGSIVGGGKAVGGSGSSPQGARVTKPGAGTSVASTGRVEKVARAWLAMPQGNRPRAPFIASWNPGGTYASAFVLVGRTEVVASPQTPERIYVGEVASVARGASGYIVTLTETHRDGRAMKFWLQNSLQAAPAGGAQIWQKLDNKEIAPGMLAFALGEFALQAFGAGFYSLPVTDARRIWFVDARDAEDSQYP